jgi:DNA-binding response OmpR family regulator
VCGIFTPPDRNNGRGSTTPTLDAPPSIPGVRILVVEDEPRMRSMLRDGLREHDHTVMTAVDGQDCLDLATAHTFDVILLDVMLPRLNGWQVVQQLRSARNPASVLMLTACDGEPDVIKGLDAGADDYLTKPFSFPELLARIKSLARSRPSMPDTLLCADTLVVDCDLHHAFRAGHSLCLTRTEMALLECLMRSSGEIVSRTTLIASIWGQNSTIGRSTLDSFINLLRKKVDLSGSLKLVHTIRGEGYCVRIQTEAAPHARREPA